MILAFILAAMVGTLALVAWIVDLQNRHDDLAARRSERAALGRAAMRCREGD